MKKICILTFGSFCDIKLSLIVADYFLKKNTQVYFIANNIPETIKINHTNIYYIINDLDKYIQLKTHDIAGEKLNLEKILKFTPLLTYINTKLYKQTEKILNECDYILVHYPALFLSNLLNKHSDKLGVFFVAPAYANIEIPYVFSDEIKNWSLKDKKEYKSSIENLIKISLGSFNPSSVLKILDKADIFTMWDSSIIKPPKTTKKIYNFSNIFYRDVFKFSTQDLKLENFLNKDKNKPLAYISVGSLSVPVTILKNTIISLLELNYLVIFHGKIDISIENENFIIYTEYIPHEYIIPKCKLIVSSGSYCMTSLANYHGVYILHIPLSNEQLFWSKCYSYNSNTDFIYQHTYYDVSKIKDIIKGITGSLKSRLYNLQLKYSLKKFDATKRLTETILKKLKN